VKGKDHGGRYEAIEARRPPDTWDAQHEAGAPRPLEGGAVEPTPCRVSSVSRGARIGIGETGAGD
jgi:hypothetical protein